MSKETRSQAVALGVIASTVVLCVFAYNCYFAVDFDKPMQFQSDAPTGCEEDIECRCEPGGVNCGENPQYDCAYCNLETNTCEHHGEDRDGDGWWVCEDARQPDCDDRDPAGTDIHPGADEVANLVDDDCDGIIDEGVLVAAAGTPQTVGKGDCTDCKWTSPSAVFASPHVSVLWESNEDVSVKQLRTTDLAFPGNPQSSVQYLYTGEAGQETFNTTEPYLATNSTDGSSLGAVWIDLLGGKKLYLATYALSPAAPELSSPTWPAGGTYPETWPDDPATPIVAARPGAPNFGVAFAGELSGATDVFFARFSSAGSLVDSDGSDFLELGASDGAEITDRPALVDAFGGYAVGWVEDGSAIALTYWSSSGSYDPAQVVVFQPEGYSSYRDPVLVASHQDPGQSLVYLLFAAEPQGDDQPEVFAASVDLDSLSPENDASEIFGPILRISESPGRLSADVAAVWWDEAIGVAWSDRRDARRSIYFRRVADLDGGGTLASTEIDLTESADDYQGQTPTVVAKSSDDAFAVVWSNSIDLFVRQIETH